MSKIGLIDVDGHNFPNLPLMKISAYHKTYGDEVEWWNSFKHYDRVYISKVFNSDFSPDIEPAIMADEIIKGGTGYCIKKILPESIENICPDYNLYPQYKEAYGFLTRGCPRNCSFCIVSKKEGRISKQVNNLNGFYGGQKTIKLLDPNLLACYDHERLLTQLAGSNAWVDFTQGLDIRLTNRDNISLLNKIKIKMLHFAWDNPDEDLTVYFENFNKFTACKDERKKRVYVLANYGSTHEQDLYRINVLRGLGYDPYVMIYDKFKFVDKRGRLLPGIYEKFTFSQIEHFKMCHRLQGWVNNKRIFRTISGFDDFFPSYKNQDEPDFIQEMII